MTTVLKTPATTTAVQDDPKKPYKTVVAFIISLLVVAIPIVRTLLGDGWSLDDTLVVLLALATPVGVYFTENPKTVA